MSNTYKAMCKKCNTETDQKRYEVNEEVYDICQTCHELNNLRFEGFHTQDNLWFRRMPDGSIMIFKHKRNEFGNIERVFCQTINIDTWGSVVCSVSKAGEDYDRWIAAKNFHQQEQTNLPKYYTAPVKEQASNLKEVPQPNWKEIEKDFYKWKEDYCEKYTFVPTPLEVFEWFKKSIGELKENNSI